MKKKLLIILNESIFDIISKGEIVKNYYNPKEYFDEVHFILINQKKINSNKLKYMSGNSKIFIYNLEYNYFKKFLVIFNFNFILEDFLYIVKKINPNLIRCYNLNYAIFLASFIKKKLEIPYIISLHIDHKDLINRKIKFYKKIIFLLIKNKIDSILRNSFKILPVYTCATNYIKDLKLNNYEICYNYIGRSTIKLFSTPKKILKLICTNRQFKDKNPINIIKAVASLKNVNLLLVGNGNFHEKLIKYVRENNLEKKVKFIKSMKNYKYLKLLNRHHALILHTNYQEFGKSVIEAMSLKKPIIINKPRIKIKELNSNFCLINSNSLEGYKKSIEYLLKNKLTIKKMGEKGYKIYKKKYESKNMELKQKNIYKNLVEYKL